MIKCHICDHQGKTAPLIYRGATHRLCMDCLRHIKTSLAKIEKAAAQSETLRSGQEKHITKIIA